MTRRRFVLSVTVAITTLGQPANAQSARDTAIAIAKLHAELSARDSLFERDVWPGYHFSQLGLLYIIPGRAKVAGNWPGEGPTGMQPLEGFANTRWTDTSSIRWQSGLPVASLAIRPRQSRAAVAGLALHEAFHAFEVTQRKKGRRFGQGENALVTASYPIFDVENEAAILVENQLLRSAVLAKTDAEARRSAQQFLAAREQRQNKLDSVFVNFEKAAELHEGLAQYALLRGLAILAQRDIAYRSGAADEMRLEQDALANSLTGSDLSVRRRAYATGSHIALLLDRLAGRSWKQRVMRDDMWLQDILASIVGKAPLARGTEARIRSATADASIAIARLRARRIQQRDSVLASAPLTLSIDPAAVGGRFDWCGFDPQNLLSTGSGQLLHTRFVNLCSSGRPIASFSAPAVEDQFTGRIATGVDPRRLQLSVNGNNTPLPAAGSSLTAERIVLKAPEIEVELARGVIVRGERILLVIPTN